MTDVEAARVLEARFGPAPPWGLVLGSGLGTVADDLVRGETVDYADIAGFPRVTVGGHPGRLSIGGWPSRPEIRVAVLRGRVHGYEGHPPERVVRPVRALARWGVSSVILTNAAGGIADRLAAGSLMVLSDHLNLTGDSPLRGGLESDSKRFVDMTEAYDPRLRATALATGLVESGVYAGVGGPQYETPAEVQMLERLGADAVGMSTVWETIALRERGVRVVAFSCITNRAAGRALRPLDHEDVKHQAARMQDSLSDVLTELFSADPPVA